MYLMRSNLQLIRQHTLFPFDGLNAKPSLIWIVQTCFQVCGMLPLFSTYNLSGRLSEFGAQHE